MRILYLLTQDLESPSGLGRYLPLAADLARRGHQVEVAALHSRFETLQQTVFDQDGVRVRYVAPMHVRKGGSGKSYYSPAQLLAVASRAAWQLSRAALTSPADIIHIGKPHPMNGMAGLLAKWLQRRPVFLDCDDYEAGVNRFATGWQKRGVVFFEQALPRRVHFVTTNTHFTRRRLVDDGIPPEKIAYIPNGVDPQRFSAPDPAQVAALRSELGLDGRQVVAFIGSLSLVGHPVDLLLEAFARIAPAHPQAALLLVGGGEDIQRLGRQAAELGIGSQTRFIGRVPPSAVPLYYRLADVTVDPVHDDGAARGRCPLKLFESWASGVPFVTADVGDRPLLVGEPPAGLLARPGDALSLAAAIAQVLDEPATARLLCRRGLERVSEFYTDRLGGELEAVYLAYLSRHS